MEKKSENITEIVKAILSVMQEVKGIDKTATIGTGQNAYKGVPDNEVKKQIGSSMAKYGLAIIPIDIEAKTKLDRWEVEYNGQKQQKQSVFTEVKTKYLLMHDSGQWIELSGYGHGVDSQDKSAGKATTYALKYTLLYAFLVPTGRIDDADVAHSDSHKVPLTPVTPVKETLSVVAFDKAIKRINAGEKDLVNKMKAAFDLNENQLNVLQDLV